MGKGPPKKYALSSPRQAPPLNYKINNLLHLLLHLPFCLHHLSPLKYYNLHNPLTKLSPSHPSKNNSWKNAAALIKSLSQGHNQLTGPSPWIWPEHHPSRHSVHLPYRRRNCSQQDRDMTLLPVKKTNRQGGWTKHTTDPAGSGFVLSRAGSSRWLPATRGTKAAAESG